MKILLTSHPGYGHFTPMANFGKILMRRGHEIAFASAACFRDNIKNNGFIPFSVGIDWSESCIENTFENYRQLSLKDRSEFIINILYNISPRVKVPELLKVIDKWHPDIIVHSSYEWSGALAAEIRDIPHAMISTSVRLPDSINNAVYLKYYQDIRAHFNLPVDKEFKKLREWLELSFMHSQWCIPGYKPHATEYFIYPEIYGSFEKGSLPERMAYMPEQPMIYATLGTVFYENPHILRAILEAFRNLDLNLVMTLGPGRDPDAFGKQPDNIFLTSFIPQSLVLEKAAGCINHGGGGTVIDSILKMVPQLLLPIHAEGGINSTVCQMHKLAHSLPSELLIKDRYGLNIIDINRVITDHIYNAVKKLMEFQNGLHFNLQKFHQSLRTLPDIGAAVYLIEDLVRERQPIFVNN